MFKWALAHGVERVNLSTGRDQSKVRWKPREVLFHSAVQVSPTLRARMTFGVFRAYETYGRLREGLKAILRLACRPSNPNLRSRPLNEAGRWRGQERSVPRREQSRIRATGAYESELTG
jgi:hypothetical protein